MEEHNARRYREQDCHCDECRADHRRVTKMERDSRRARLKADPTLAPHGKNSTYTNWGCHCVRCAQAHVEARLR